jgi:hypothetical protein
MDVRRTNLDKRVSVSVTPLREDRRMEVNYDERKLTELLLYIAERLLPDTSGGATKLNKVLLRGLRPCSAHRIAHHRRRVPEAASRPGASAAEADS